MFDGPRTIRPPSPPSTQLPGRAPQECSIEVLLSLRVLQPAAAMHPPKLIILDVAVSQLKAQTNPTVHTMLWRALGYVTTSSFFISVFPLGSRQNASFSCRRSLACQWHTYFDQIRKPPQRFRKKGDSRSSRGLSSDGRWKCVFFPLWKGLRTVMSGNPPVLNGPDAR